MPKESIKSDSKFLSNVQKPCWLNVNACAVLPTLLTILGLTLALTGCSFTGTPDLAEPSGPSIQATAIMPTPLPTPLGGGQGRIAFSSSQIESGIYLARTDGSPVTFLTKGRMPAWSPEGDRLVFERQGKIFLINADGSGETPLLKETHPRWAFIRSELPRWSPDGQRILFSAEIQIPDDSFYPLFRSHDYIVNIDGSNITPLTGPAIWQMTESDWYNFWYGSAIWSPDGSRIALVENDYSLQPKANLYLVNPDGTNWVDVGDLSKTHLFSISGRGRAWSPDGKQIAFSGAAIEGENASIYRVNVDGTGLLRLTHNPERHDSGLAWSPDGKKIAFSGQVIGEENSSIYCINVDGTGLTRLTHNPERRDSNANWSPDSTLIAFDSKDGPRLEIRIVKVDGSAEWSLTNERSSSKPAWAP